MQQIPYSFLRMLCHILIGFVGGTIFFTSGKALVAHPFHAAAEDIISPATSPSRISMPLREISNQAPIAPAGKKPHQLPD